MASDEAETKKLHWTQTPEGRERVSRISRQRWKDKKAKPRRGRPPKAARSEAPKPRRGGADDKVRLLVDALDERGAKELLLKIMLER